MRPCDCKDEFTASQLEIQGLAMNNNRISVTGGRVRLEVGVLRVYIPMGIFQRFAEWYLEHQDTGGAND